MRDFEPVGDTQHASSPLLPVPDINTSITPGSNALPVREGLPATYRMRADAHYVDQLDSSPALVIQMIAVETIEAGEATATDAALTDSIRRHGILEPLLVQRRDRRYRLVTGRKRLAAAKALGLREVPCAVRRLTDDEVRALAVVAAPTPQGPTATVHAAPIVDANTLATALESVLSCTALLADGVPSLTRRVAVDMVRAETQRAISVLRTAAALAEEGRDMRREVAPRRLVDALVAAVAAEARLRGTVVTAHVEASDHARVAVDEKAVVSSMTAVVLMLAAGLHDLQGAKLDVTARCDAGRTLTIMLAQESVILPTTLLSRANGEHGGDVDATLAALLALRRSAESHGGTFSVSRLPRGTEVAITLPLVEAGASR